MRRIPGELQVFASLLPARLLLRHASRHDLVLAGGDGALHDPGLPPGAGSWLGARVQVAVGNGAAPPDPPAACEPLARDRALAVVTTRPAEVARRLRAVGYRVSGPEGQEAAAAGVALVADVDEWQSRWGALSALRPIAAVVFDGCSSGDLRQLARTRQSPPPLPPDHAWLLRDDGEVVRTRLPGR
jgi:S-DNA-T family DNA segregation ATPase FtsK/SpoIIIE